MKNKNTLIILLSLVVLGLAFYWYQVRPANIKHDCSWVKVHEDMIPEVTQEEIDAGNKAKADCQVKYPNSNTLENFNCNAAAEQQHAGESPRNSIPEKDYYRKASATEYSFCLHNKGL